MIDIKKYFEFVEDFKSNYCEPLHYYGFYGHFNGVKILVAIRRYDYLDIELYCIDRDDCFNKESQCPMFVTSDIFEEDKFLEDLKLLASKEGLEASENWDSSKFIYGDSKIRSEFYNN